MANHRIEFEVDFGDGEELANYFRADDALDGDMKGADDIVLHDTIYLGNDRKDSKFYYQVKVDRDAGGMTRQKLAENIMIWLTARCMYYRMQYLLEHDQDVTSENVDLDCTADLAVHAIELVPGLLRNGYPVYKIELSS